MRRLVARRWIAGAATVAAAAIALFVVRDRYATLRDAAFFTGWVLAGMMAFLAVYNLRKKLAYPPLLASAAWLQAHIYIGLLSIFVFLLHVGLVVPNGPFETALALVYAAVALSGVAGLLLSRAIPPRLAARGEEVVYERIPMLRRRLREQAEDLVAGSAATAGGGVLAEFYTHQLAGFFAGPRHFWRHLSQSSRPCRALLTDLRSIERYLDEAERAHAADLAGIIEAKEGLDYHWAMQGVLKGWLFVHIPLTYVLLIMLVVHAVIVHTFDHAP